MKSHPLLLGIGVAIQIIAANIAIAQCEPTHWVFGQFLPVRGIQAAIEVSTPNGPRLILGTTRTTLHDSSAGPLFSFDGDDTTPFPAFDSRTFEFPSDPGSWVTCFGRLGDQVFAGGRFRRFPSLLGTSLVSLQDDQWVPLSPPLPGIIEAMAVCNNTLYAGGSPGLFRSWNGSAWRVLDGYVNGDISALAAAGSSLYITGAFTAAGSVDAVRIAIWDGTDFRRATTGLGPNDVVNKVIAADDGMYVAGSFTRIDGQLATGLARLHPGSLAEPIAPLTGSIVRPQSRNGHLASASSTGIYEFINGLWQLAVPGDFSWSVGITTFGGQEYAFGPAMNANTLTAPLQRITPQGPFPAARAAGNITRSLRVGDQTMICGAMFDGISPFPRRFTVQNGSLVSDLDLPPGLTIRCATEHLGELYIAGDLTSATAACGFYKRVGNAWVDLLPTSTFRGVSGSITELVSAGGHLYLTGNFFIIPNDLAANFRAAAEYDNSGIHPLSTAAATASVTSALAFENSLVVLGTGTALNGKIARWTGSVFENLGPIGFTTSAPFSLLFHEGNLVALAGARLFRYRGTPGLWEEISPPRGVLSNQRPPLQFDDCLIGYTEIPIKFQNDIWRRLPADPFPGGQSSTSVLLPSPGFLFAATNSASAAIYHVQCPCVADLTNDGVVDFFDYLEFIAWFSTGDIRADISLDNLVDFFDYLDFLDSFASGC